MPRYIITTPRNFSLTLTEAASATAWQDALLASKSSRIYLWPKFFDVKDSSEKAVYEESALSSQKVRDGRYKFEISIVGSLCLHKAMFTHSGNSNQRVFIVDNQNQIFGSINSDGDFCGFDVELLNVEKLMFNDGKVSSKTPVYLVLSDNTEIDNNGYLINASSFFTSLIPLTDVDLAQVGSSTTSLIKVTVKVSCDGTSVDGLVSGDFDVRDSSGAAITHTVTQGTDGVYSLASATLFAPGDTVNLVAASALTVEGYESTGKITVV
jgi:hypothetical protein